MADHVAQNVGAHPDLFDPEVILFFRDGDLARKVIATHRNEKYLPTIELHPNLHPTDSLDEALGKASILIFAIPHAFVAEFGQRMADVVNRQKGGKVPTMGISLTKGVSFDARGQLELMSSVYERMVGIPVGALSGANIAIEVAKGQYCEAVLAPPRLESLPKGAMVQLLLAMFEADHFKVRFSADQKTVELCGALKNIISCGVGLIDGLGYRINTKAAAMACGLRELRRFLAFFHPGYDENVLFDSCGVADIVVSSFAGRNLRVAKEFAAQKLTEGVLDLEQLEAKVLRGQKLQGPGTAMHVYHMLASEKKLDEFPFFAAVHRIFNEGLDASAILEAIRD